ncbi:MAG: M48 family metallopeptidase [Clostridia bacterium]|nr:M48 family metallopeptidase [Clostridia bacterium]
MEIEYEIIRSNRRTLGISVTADGKILVRAPKFLSEEIIVQQVEKSENWIKKALERSKTRKKSPMNTDFDPKTVAALKKKTLKIVIPMVEKFSKLMKVSPTGVKITSAKTRYGSCNGENSICFSFRLSLFPAEAVEAVVVHELAHIKHKNHGKNFYACIYKVLPDYDERKRRLIL